MNMLINAWHIDTTMRVFRLVTSLYHDQEVDRMLKRWYSSRERESLIGHMRMMNELIIAL